MRARLKISEEDTEEYIVTQAMADKVVARHLDPAIKYQPQFVSRKVLNFTSDS